MTLTVTPEQLTLLAPSARSSYRAAFAAGQLVLDSFAIADNPLRLAHFMAQIMHESVGLSFQFENLNYSAGRLPKVWPKRFLPRGPLDPLEYEHNPEKLANEVYGGRMGNTSPGDGYRYRGRGLLQLTGKDSYAEATTILRQSNPGCPDFTAEPDAVISAEWALWIAAAEWQAKGCNALADKDDLTGVTRKINGGTIGLSERDEWLKRTKQIWS